MTFQLQWQLAIVSRNQRPLLNRLGLRYYHGSAAVHSRNDNVDGNGSHRDLTTNAYGTASSSTKQKGILPGIQRIMLVRHGESFGNIDERAYTATADWRIPLTERGREQARLAGKMVNSHLRIDDDDETKPGVFFYVSPYLRTRQTLREILREIDPECVVGIREDPRM